MDNLVDLMERLGPVIDVSLNTWTRNRDLFPLSDSVHSIQMAYYWLKRATEELTQPGEGITLEQGFESTKEGVIKPPTLLSTTEQLTYIKDQLTNLTKEMVEYTSTVSLPPRVLYKTDRGYDRLMEALFDTETATTQYNMMNGRSRN